MARKNFRLFAAAVAAFFMVSDLAAAMPVAPAPEAGVAATLARGRHGGGMRGGGGMRRGGGGAIHRGGGHNVVRGGRNAVVVGRLGAMGRGGAWRRGYRWPPGGAIAAGAAIGVLAASAAVAYTSTRPPAAGLCWYYQDSSYASGFWDVCP